MAKFPAAASALRVAFSLGKGGPATAPPQPPADAPFFLLIRRRFARHVRAGIGGYKPETPD
jgi:hypothetical protein